MSPSAPARPPRHFGRRSWRSVEFASLDFETTGLDPRRDHILSFGVVPIREGRIVMSDGVYREVAPAVPPSPVSVTVHGLRHVDLAAARDLDAERGVLGAALHRRFIIAWAAEVEAAFLATTFGGSARSWRRRIVDVLVLARLADELQGAGGSPSYALTAAAERFGVPVHSPHDAFDDALTTAQVFLVVATRLSATPSTARWFLRASRSGRI
ncbi:MAG: 3'-5' exonuclease [Actinomycetota bacterium]